MEIFSSIDLRTVIFLLFLGNLIVIITLAAYRKNAIQSANYLYFLLGKMLQAIGWLLIAERNILPNLYSAYWGNSILMAGFTLEIIAITTIDQPNPRWQRFSAIICAGGILGFWLLTVTPNQWVIESSFANFLIYSVASIYLLRQSNRSSLRISMGLVYLLYGVILFIRGVASFTSKDITLLSNNLIQYLSYITPFFVMLFGSLGFSLLHREKIDAKLLQANQALSSANASLTVEIEERKQVEAALQLSEEKYRFLAEGMKDVIWVIDPETLRFLYVSPSVQQLRGYTPEEVMAEPMDAALTAEGAKYIRDLVKERVAALLANQEMDTALFYTQEIEQPCKDGTTVWTEVITTYKRIKRTERIEVHGVSREITERKQAEAALLAAHAELEQRVQERTAELQTANLALEKAGHLKDEFLAAMSHELRTPLTGVLGLTQVLRLKVYGPLTEKQDVALVNIEAGGQRLLQLVTDILFYTQLQAGAVQPRLGLISLEEVCQVCFNTNKPQAETKHLHSSIRLEPTNIILRADEKLVQQAINHLLNNAIKFTGNDGWFGIDMKGDVSARQVRITVWDTGIGIQTEDFPRLFQPFRQLDGRLARQFTGTGLGLALVRRLVELQGGSVEVESIFGEGSRFSLILPWQPEED